MGSSEEELDAEVCGGALADWGKTDGGLELSSVPLEGDAGEVWSTCSRSCTKVLMGAINNPVTVLVKGWTWLLSRKTKMAKLEDVYWRTPEQTNTESQWLRWETALKIRLWGLTNSGWDKTMMVRWQWVQILSMIREAVVNRWSVFSQMRKDRVGEPGEVCQEHALTYSDFVCLMLKTSNKIVFILFKIFQLGFFKPISQFVYRIYFIFN